jgi:hypothetical protein
MASEQEKYVNSHPRRYYQDLQGVEYCLELIDNCKNISENTRTELLVIVQAINYTDKAAAQAAMNILGDTLFALKQGKAPCEYPVPAALEEKAAYGKRMIAQIAAGAKVMQPQPREEDEKKYKDLPPLETVEDLEDDHYSFMFSSLPDDVKLHDALPRDQLDHFLTRYDERLDNLNEDLRETINLSRKLEKLFSEFKKMLFNSYIGSAAAKTV